MLRTKARYVRFPVLCFLWRDAGGQRAINGGRANMPEPHLQHWALLYNDCLAETDPSKLRSLVVALEEAIVFRLQELSGKAEGQHETLALQTAAENLLKIKTTKLPAA